MLQVTNKETEERLMAIIQGNKKDTEDQLQALKQQLDKTKSAVGRKIPVTAQYEYEHWARLMTFCSLPRLVT